MSTGKSNSERKRIERLEALTQRQAAFLATIGVRPQANNNHRDSRLAVTVYTSDYPEKDGDGVPKFPIKFIDATFTKTQGWEALKTLPRGNPMADYDAIAASVNGTWVPVGTIVNADWQRPPVGLAAGDENAGEWFIEATKPSPTGRIGFLMTSVRSRLRHPDNSRYGQATATVAWVAGDVPCVVGDTITVTFPNDRWFGAVENCNGEADYFPNYTVPGDSEGDTQLTITQDIYIVTECQELMTGFWGETLEDRAAGAPQQDVLCNVVTPIGHTNGDFNPELWKPQNNGTFDCGTLRWAWIPDAISFPQTGGSWDVTVAPGSVSPSPCCALDETEPSPPDDPTTTGYFVDRPAGSPGPDCEPPGGQGGLKVRYHAGTFPRMRAGALFYCEFDNDISNKTSNSGMFYSVVVSNQVTMGIKWGLAENNCGLPITTGSVIVLDAWPFSQAPALPLIVANKHSGMYGDEWKARWNGTAQQYEVWDMDGHEVTALINFASNTVDGCVTKTAQSQQMKVELCAPAGDPVTLDEYHLRTIDTPTGPIRIESGQTGDAGSGQEQCDPKMFLDVVRTVVKATCATQSVPDPLETPLHTKNVVIGFVVIGDCKYPVYQERIDLGQCGINFNDPDPLFCKEPLECPESEPPP